jgi:hypothetical protein
MKKVKFLVVVLALTGAMVSNAQFSTGVDLVSNYVWRGVQQDLTYGKGTPNIQPSLSYTLGNLTIGTWGSYGILGTVKEVDLYASYAISDLFSVTVTDYNWNFTKNYFSYSKGTDHVFEGSLNYAGIEAFPLSLSLNTMFYGADLKEDGSQAYSTYFEMGYPVTESASLFLGGALNASPAYGTDGFGITNVGLKLKKSIEITDKFSLPLFGVLGVNPKVGDAFLVVGVSL